MTSQRINQRLAAMLILLLSVAFIVATYHAIKNIVAEQSSLQQRALSPVYKLVRDELLRPLYIAETFAGSVDFTTIIDTPDIDEAVLLAHLAKMERDLDLVFFVASERARRQYFSNGSTLDLVEGKVWWYFEAIEQGKDIMADLGQVGDVHLYFDVKMYNENREFLGFVGVGKRIRRFLDTFEQYKSQYGYDFLFVNDSNEIILSSLPELVVTDEYIPTLESLDWFAESSLALESLDSQLVELGGEDFLISEIAIEELDWQLLLLVPLEARQSQITASFIANTLAAIIIVVLLVGSIFYLLLVYKSSLEKKTEIDQLSRLPNRTHIQRRFNQLRRANAQLCVIIIDLDHFKKINDSHGHNFGDRVIQGVAADLKQGLREMDVVGRWGGEEFVMLIPATSIDMGEIVAERARASLAALKFEAPSATVSITASFGIAFGASEEPLSRLLGHADVALYEAKRGGRNRVVVYEAD